MPRLRRSAYTMAAAMTEGRQLRKAMSGSDCVTCAPARPPSAPTPRRHSQGNRLRQSGPTDVRCSHGLFPWAQPHPKLLRSTPVQCFSSWHGLLLVSAPRRQASGVHALLLEGIKAHRRTSWKAQPATACMVPVSR